jgi:two-component system phosphate regulon sensor histidine kinase PhoR
VRLGIRSKLFVLALGLVVVSFVAADIYLSTTLDRLLTENIRDDLMVRLDLVRHDAAALSAPLDDNTAWDALADETGRLARARVTIIRRDGVVLGDSQVSLNQLTGLENHIDRPEVAEALAKGQGESTRYSTTIKGRMLYAAMAFHRGNETAGVVRIAMPLVEIDQSLEKLRRLLIFASLLALVLAILLSAVATQLASRNVRALTSAARTMAKGDLSIRTTVTGHDEFAELGRTLDRLAQSLSASLADLRSERDLLERILTGMQEGILLVDSTGRLSLFNPAFREMFLLNADVVGHPLLEIIRHAELKALLDQAVSSGIAVSGEIDVVGIKPRRLLVHASAIAGDRGTLLVLVDVTDIRRLESLRRDFVANASHELRTPVASVRSALETLQGALTADPAAAADFLDIIDRNVKRLHQLIEDLLDLSRIESREFKLHLECLGLGSVIADALSVFHERAEKKQITLRQLLPADLPPVRADRRAVEQVLTNLIDNAVKYCPEGAEVSVRAIADGSLVRVSVEDTGPGIESQHLPRLFERFYRVDPGRSRELGGTGLGLSIVKHLVEAMGQTIDVESTFGRGTTFSFTLPRFNV